MGASYSHSFQPSLHSPSVIHRLHQGKVDHLFLVLVSKVYVGSFKILDQSVFCYRALSSLAFVAKALSKRLRVKPISQSILSKEKKREKKKKLSPILFCRRHRCKHNPGAATKSQILPLEDHQGRPIGEVLTGQEKVKKMYIHGNDDNANVEDDDD